MTDDHLLQAAIESQHDHSNCIKKTAPLLPAQPLSCLLRALFTAIREFRSIQPIAQRKLRQCTSKHRPKAAAKLGETAMH